METQKVEKYAKNPFYENWESNTDVIMLVEDQKLFLHKWALSQHSPVFESMLNGNFKESIENEITLPNKKAVYVIEMLEFFYPKLFKTIKGESL